MKTRRWRGWAVALVGAGSLILAGCGAAPTTSSTGIAPGLNANSVTLNVGTQVEPNDYFPIVSAAACSTVNGSVTSEMYAPLLFVNTKDQFEFSKSVASSIAVSHNDTVYTINLHHSWKWSNGTPVTAQDVVYTWDIIYASAQKNAPWTFCGVGSGGIPTLWKSVVATGPYQVTVTINTPTNPTWVEYNALSNLTPIPKATWDKYSNMNQELSWINSISNSPSNPAFSVVDGPYKFSKYVNNEYWALTANPAYVLKKPQIKELIFDYETSDSNLFASLRKGTFAYSTIPAEYNADVHELPTYYKVQTSPYSFCNNYLYPNFDTTGPEAAYGKMFSQLAVRQALQYGIDQPSIIKLMGGPTLATEEYSPVPPQPTNPFADKNLKVPYPYNIQKGIQVLKKDGWHMVNGVMTKNGQQLAFQFLVASGSQVNTNIAELIQADWAKEGIKATIKEEPFNQVIATNDTNFQFEWWGGGWCYGATDPTGDQLFSSTSSANTDAYNNPTMNKLIAESIAPQTPAHAQQVLDQYEQFAADNLPILYLPEPTGLQVVKTGLHGVNRYTNDISGYVQYNYWTIGK